ncbi:MAG: hypothetical protein ACRDG4_00705, partial [Chloroflexota bacterium]
MRRQVTSIVALTTIIGTLFLVPATTHAAPSSVNHTTYQFFVGAAPVEGPDVSTAPNGSTLTMTGAGQFDAGPNKSVSGGGDYMIQDASGATVASGTWTATQMLGFVNYGSGAVQGAPSFFYGGQVQMKVDLDGLGSGLLNINCTLGTPPPGHNGPLNASG